MTAINSMTITFHVNWILLVDYKSFRALKLLCKKDFLTPAELCKELKAMGSSKFALGDLGKMLDSYPEIFMQNPAYVFANPDAALLLSRLLPLANNVEVGKSAR